MQTVTRSLLYGISSYTLYYARQPQHDMNRPRIYCFKKNKEKNENQFKLTDFDYLTADPKLQMLKAAIPYLPVSQQRAVSLLVKIQELQRAQSLFDGEEISAMGLSPSTPKPATPIQLLQIIKPYAGPREREMIEMLENFQIMKEVL